MLNLQNKFHRFWLQEHLTSLPRRTQAIYTHLCHERSHFQPQLLTDRKVPLLYLFINLISQQEALSFGFSFSLGSETKPERNVE